MNAPLHHGAAKCLAIVHPALQVFALFHLNLAFSSIEEERRGEVIDRCYWPLLRMAERIGPIGLEISGYSLEEIALRDPVWIASARELIAAGRIELIGSGYSQMIGPLVPARVTAENLRLGLMSYQRLLGARPRLALVNEQAYAGGLVALYRAAGFEALVMDWDNPAAQHPEWDSEFQYLPQYATGPEGDDIALVWSNTTLFQQLQRFAHGDIELSAWRAFVRSRRAPRGRSLCLYASDAEIFDFRPGRFHTEEKLSDAGEWDRIEAAFKTVVEDGATWVAPSASLGLMDLPGAGNRLILESPVCPVPVKKQRKYNLARWAVTGRDNLAINAACQRIYQGMCANDAGADWKELCYLWASDFRTHLTEARWTRYCARLKAAESRWSGPLAAANPAPQTPALQDRFVAVETASLKARLDRRRGLALQSLHFAPHARAAVGGLPHGFFDDIALAADWYTGDCVFEAPGEHKLTDLDWCEARLETVANGDVLVHADIETINGRIEKRMRFCAAAPRVEFDLTFHWEDWGKGVLRLGHFTLLPEAFNADALVLATTNGGARESFAPAGLSIDHGAPVSFLVSSSHGLGMTEGWVEIGDGRTNLRIEVDRAVAPLLGMLIHRPANTNRGDRSLFCQLQLSALELDDTYKPGCYRGGPRRFRFSIGAV
jgi:hypothetical protein